MKRHLRFILAQALAFALAFQALAVPVLADSETLTETGTSFAEIVVEYRAATDNRADIEAGAAYTRAYKVTLEWEPAGKIVYNAGKTIYSWDGNGLKYDTEVTGKGWTVSDAKVVFTVKNRSNRPVEVECHDPAPINGVTVTGSYDISTMTIPSAAVNGFDGVGEEQSAQAVYSIRSVSGDISSSTTSIASITTVVTGK